MSFVERVRWLETLFQAGVLKGEVVPAELADVLRHRDAGNPFAAAELDLVALEWALLRVPEHIGARDVIWLVPAAQLSGEGWQRVGVSEWAVATDEASAREWALALAVLTESSRVLRERLLGDDLLHELTLSDAPASFIDALAQRLDVHADSLSAVHEQMPSFLIRLLTLAQHAFAPRVRVRVAPSAVVEPLWQALLAELFAARADSRRIGVVVAPLWVCDLVSPYVRDVSELLLKWAAGHPELEALTQALQDGDADAASLVAELFCRYEPRVLDERQAREAKHGITTLRDESGRTLARVIDAAALAVGRLDDRVGLPSEDALIVVLDPSAPETTTLLGRLLSDVQAQWLGVEICVPARTLAEDDVVVASAPAALGVDGARLLPFGGAAEVKPLAIPALAYVDVVPLHDVEADIAYVTRTDQLDALAAWMQAGGGDQVVKQRFWISDEAELDLGARAGQAADVAEVFRRWLGGVDKPRGREVTARAREDLGLAPPNRFRV